MMPPILRSRWTAIAGGAVAVAVIAAVILFWLPNPRVNPAGVVVTIPRGASFHSVVDSLDRAGVLRSAFTFRIAGRILGYTKQIKVGKYLFAPGMSNLEILSDIEVGKSRLIIAVTIPEGWRMDAIIRKYRRDLGIDADRLEALCTDSAFVHRLGFDGSSLEGYLMPDTYSFYWQTDEREIVERMVEQFRLFYVDSLRARQHELHASLREIVTLASIVEAESGVDNERSAIAGVYWNRLQKGMKLEADPTVQYALGSTPRRLTFRDLQLESPYNTYRRFGLPPGPINNPGRKAILAALYPEHHQYLYFVATGQGGHRFSRSFAEHERAIRLYHQARRQQRRMLRESAQSATPGISQ